MRDFQKRRARGAQILRVAVGGACMLALAGVAFLATRSAASMYGKFSEASVAQSSAEGELADLQARYASVKAQVDELGTDRGVEAAIRERYGVVKPGEGELDIVRQSTTTGAAPQQPGLFDRLWHLLFVW